MDDMAVHASNDKIGYTSLLLVDNVVTRLVQYLTDGDVRLFARLVLLLGERVSKCILANTIHMHVILTNKQQRARMWLMDTLARMPRLATLQWTDEGAFDPTLVLPTPVILTNLKTLTVVARSNDASLLPPLAVPCGIAAPNVERLVCVYGGASTPSMNASVVDFTSITKIGVPFTTYINLAELNLTFVTDTARGLDLMPCPNLQQLYVGFKTAVVPFRFFNAGVESCKNLRVVGLFNVALQNNQEDPMSQVTCLRFHSFIREIRGNDRHFLQTAFPNIVALDTNLIFGNLLTQCFPKLQTISSDTASVFMEYWTLVCEGKLGIDNGVFASPAMDQRGSISVTHNGDLYRICVEQPIQHEYDTVTINTRQLIYMLRYEMPPTGVHPTHIVPPPDNASRYTYLLSPHDIVHCLTSLPLITVALRSITLDSTCMLYLELLDVFNVESAPCLEHADIYVGEQAASNGPTSPDSMWSRISRWSRRMQSLALTFHIIDTKVSDQNAAFEGLKPRVENHYQVINLSLLLNHMPHLKVLRLEDGIDVIPWTHDLVLPDIGDDHLVAQWLEQQKPLKTRWLTNIQFNMFRNGASSSIPVVCVAWLMTHEKSGLFHPTKQSTHVQWFQGANDVETTVMIRGAPHIKRTRGLMYDAKALACALSTMVPGFGHRVSASFICHEVTNSPTLTAPRRMEMIGEQVSPLMPQLIFSNSSNPWFYEQTTSVTYIGATPIRCVSHHHQTQCITLRGGKCIK